MTISIFTFRLVSSFLPFVCVCTCVCVCAYARLSSMCACVCFAFVCMSVCVNGDSLNFKPELFSPNQLFKYNFILYTWSPPRVTSLQGNAVSYLRCRHGRAAGGRWNRGDGATARPCAWQIKTGGLVASIASRVAPHWTYIVSTFWSFLSLCLEQKINDLHYAQKLEYVLD